MDQKEQIAQQTIIEDEPKVSLAEKLREKRKLQRKKMTKRVMQIAGGLFFCYIMWLGFKPFKASAEYGICRTMLELHIPYPHTLYVSEMRIKRDGTLELWYTHIDAFGEYRMEPLLCRIEYHADPETNLPTPKVTELKFNKINLGPERLAFLNNAMPYFVEFPLIQVYPAALPDSLADLQIDSERFRKIQLGNIRK
jgi:hypothetical protein